MRKLGEPLNIDFSRIPLNMDALEKTDMPEMAVMMRRVMCASLDHNEFMRVLLDKNTRCHVDSMYKAMTDREAAYRSHRPGREFWSEAQPDPDFSQFAMCKARACTAFGYLIHGVESQLKAQGIEMAFETRMDMNRYDAVTARFDNNRTVIFLDTARIQAHGRNDRELAMDSLARLPDSCYFDAVMRLFHTACHAVQLHECDLDKHDPVYDAMIRQFRLSHKDPAYYMANYSEFLPDLEADVIAIQTMMEYMKAAFPNADMNSLFVSYFKRKASLYNFENQVYAVGSQGLDTFEMILTGLTVKMFKMARWYATEPAHDGHEGIAALS